MNILCDECTHKFVCTYTKDFEHIINRIDNVGLITSTKVSDTKRLNDFDWFFLFGYSPAEYNFPVKKLVGMTVEEAFRLKVKLDCEYFERHDY